MVFLPFVSVGGMTQMSSQNEKASACKTHAEAVITSVGQAHHEQVGGIFIGSRNALIADMITDNPDLFETVVLLKSKAPSPLAIGVQVQPSSGNP
jgi:hypothetical protein